MVLFQALVPFGAVGSVCRLVHRKRGDCLMLSKGRSTLLDSGIQVSGALQVRELCA